MPIQHNDRVSIKFTRKVEAVLSICTKRGVKVRINPDWFNALAPAFQVAVLQHEMAHAHVALTSRRPLSKSDVVRAAASAAALLKE